MDGNRANALEFQFFKSNEEEIALAKITITEFILPQEANDVICQLFNLVLPHQSEMDNKYDLSGKYRNENFPKLIA